MTDRIELLKEVATVAPEEMNARLRDGAIANYKVEMNGGTLYLDEKFKEGDAIIAMLDAMEKAGWIVQLDNHPSGVYRIMAWRERDPGNTCAISVERVNTNGKTRAEAVAKAFVAVFKEKEA